MRSLSLSLTVRILVSFRLLYAFKFRKLLAKKQRGKAHLKRRDNHISIPVKNSQKSNLFKVSEIGESKVASLYSLCELT